MKAFEESDKFNWPLTESALAVDVGAYEGNWSREMAAKFRCQIWAFEPVFHEQVSALMLPKTTVFPAALGAAQAVEEYGVKGDSTGAYATSEDKRSVTVLPVSLLYNLSHVGVIKINAEGAEFEILEQIIADGKMPMFDNLLIQYHSVALNAQNRRDLIQKSISETHDCLFDAPWIWEGWQLKKLTT